jgi:oligopeptidase B
MGVNRYTGIEMSQNPLPTPPVVRKIHTETRMHGVLLADDYAWLRDKENPDVTAYLEAENAYADAVMAPLAGLREELYQEMLSHVKQTDVSVPYRDGAWWYYTRTEEGLQYGIHCRKRGGPAGATADATEEVLLDGNQLAKGQAFFAIGDTDITDDGRWLAYTTDTKGFRQYTLRIKDLETGETLAGEVERVGSVVWAADNRTLFYTVEDEQQKRQFQLWRHVLGTPHADDALVYQDDDERFNIAAGRTRDGKFIVVESGSHTTSEARVLRADDPSGIFAVIAPREDEHEYSVDHRNGLWFIRTNDRGRNFRLVTAPVTTPGREHWTERIAHRDAVMIEDVDLFAGFFVACEREDGLPRLRLWKFAGDGAEARLPARLPSPSRPTARTRTSIASSRRRRFATRINRWSRQARCTSTTWRRARRRC